MGTDLILFPGPVLAAKGAACFTCFAQLPTLNKCSRCKRIRYCSQKCQKKDWNDGHKKLCKVLLGLSDFYPPVEAQTWQQYRQQVLSSVAALRVCGAQVKPITLNDERILLYQAYCSNCYRTPLQLAPDTKLKLCPNCFIAATCTSCSSTPETHACAKLFSIARAEMFAIDHFLKTGEPTIQMPTELPRSTYRPLSTAASWLDYFTVISEKSMLVGKISPDLQPLQPEYDQLASALTAASDKHSMILTTLAAFEAAIPDLPTKEHITLHLVGATGKELDALMLFEELLHLLPKLRALSYAFVGPQLPKPMEGTHSVALDCCPPCTNAGRSRTMSMFQGSYHEYVKGADFALPDLAVVFHSGHSQEAQEEWKPTIEYLVEAGFPTAFTTFNEKEMLEETQGLRRMGAKFVQEGEKNRWMGMRPLLDPMEEEEGSVYHMNMYWYMIAGSGMRT
ncbi:uncharacterized protein L3040_008849 [Drepanopeziza brunnea f. sp. 'multigermtubi']|uniref:MYND-type domain-containing protein n=1 Tax=Marssonina brunnea f. sp. multigermtubi (strain MB_m1) TaxID=1072389 RepID=K1WW19_MARBU|nr:uncharacterized protein MBM_04783 [Drepanopeziza brunnea f. sp. 'multigermtubi' MB_m1]EKD17206.1 hypothetical protein MBM_04783 [Drepanopeziza brunnea f. sp. 'multigermtubi' MB_m1]KAJ5032240.1 hypothetical protein L3040_008849 [Drepanopeziza brunnea f. sp. 'multigermtubi']